MILCAFSFLNFGFDPFDFFINFILNFIKFKKDCTKMMTENSIDETAAEAVEATTTTSPRRNWQPMTDFRRFSNPIAQPIRNFALTNPELEQITTATAAKIDSLKKWTVSTYKNTKHMCMEQLGKIDKTVDKELEERVESLRELRKSYRELLSSAQHFSNYLGLANTMQRHMASAFCELGTKETAIAKELNCQSELLGLMHQNQEALQRKLALFLSSLATLTDSTIEDTFLTIESHDQARLEFDVARQELQAARQSLASQETQAAGRETRTAESIAALEEDCARRKQKYEQLKEDVRAKLVLLEENRCKVMRKQIVSLQKAFATCLTDNGQAVERARADLANMGLTENEALGHSQSNNNSFLEK